MRENIAFGGVFLHFIGCLKKICARNPFYIKALRYFAKKIIKNFKKIFKNPLTNEKFLL